MTVTSTPIEQAQPHEIVGGMGLTGAEAMALQEASGSAILLQETGRPPRQKYTKFAQ